MSGRLLMIGLIAFTAVFAAALYYFQVFAFYERASSPPPVAADAAVSGYEGIDAASSPLKLRGCFRAEPAAFADAAPAADPEPLLAPFWFRCFDARAIGEDLAAGRAEAYALAVDDPPGFDTIAALYPDGRGYLWRQLNDRYRN